MSNLWHTDGFPGLFALFNSPDDAVVEGALAKMQSQWKAWQQALDHSHTPFIKKGTDRSYMSQVAISEAFEVAAHYEFKGAELKGILKEFAADAFILGYTKLVEDAFQRVRGKETTQHPNHVMSHEAVWKAPIIKHVLDEVHKYQAISHEDCPARERISVASSLNPSMFKGHQLNAVSTSKISWARSPRQTGQLSPTFLVASSMQTWLSGIIANSMAVGTRHRWPG